MNFIFSFCTCIILAPDKPLWHLAGAAVCMSTAIYCAIKYDRISEPK